MGRRQHQQQAQMAVTADLFARRQHQRASFTLILLEALAAHQVAMETPALPMISRIGNWVQAAAVVPTPRVRPRGLAATARSQAVVAAAAQRATTALRAARAATAATGG
jgi:hypothetical protein